MLSGGGRTPNYLFAPQRNTVRITEIVDEDELEDGDEADIVTESVSDVSEDEGSFSGSETESIDSGSGSSGTDTESGSGSDTEETTFSYTGSESESETDDDGDSVL